MLEKRLILAIKIFVYASFIMPLILLGSTFIFPFVFPKAIYFRIVVELMLGLYILLCLKNKDYRPQKTPLFFVLCFLFFVLLLSCFFGVDFQRSFWGNFERMSGWFTLIHFGIYFVIVANVFKSWPEWCNLLRWSLVTSFFVGLTGLNFLLSENSIMKIGGGGTLGNFIYLANFVLFHVFIAWYLFRKEEKKSWKIFAAVLGIIGIMIMIYNGKRGPLLGLITGGFFGLILYSALTKIKKWKTFGLGLIGLVIILSFLAIIYRQSSFVQKIPVVGQLANISFHSGTGETRAIAWNIAYQAWKEKPIFGWGVENFYYAFNKYYNPKSLEHGYYETWFDRSHNIFLDYLSTSGILGLFGYLAVFFAVFWLAGASYKRKKIDLDTLVFLTIFFVAYGVQNFFVFDHLSSYLIFFLILAFVNVVAEKSLIGDSVKIDQKLNKGQSSRLSLAWVIIVGSAILFFVYKTNIKPAQANNSDLESQRMAQSNFSKGFENMKKTIEIDGAHLTDVRNDFAKVIISYSQNAEALKSNVYKQAVSFIMEELKKNVGNHPLELQSWISLAQYYILVEDLQQAEESFQQARSLSPKRQQVAYMLVRIKAMRRDYDGAIKILNKTIEDGPNIPDSYWYLSLVYDDLGEKNKSYDNLKIALAKNKNFSMIQEFLFAAKVMKDHNDLENARNLYEQALQKNQNDPAVLLSLSEIYSLLGNKFKAKEMADRAALYDPQALIKAKAWLR